MFTQRPQDLAKAVAVQCVAQASVTLILSDRERLLRAKSSYGGFHLCTVVHFFSHMCLSKVFNCSDGLDYMARSLAWKLLDHLLQTELCMAGSLKPNSGHGQVFQGHRILGSLVLF